MLGFYNVSVILTYIGLVTAVCGMGLAMDGRPSAAVACLMICGVCDMFDGSIARRTKRSEDAKVFGIQIDSLCDLICFGALPAVIGFSLGMDGVLGYAVLGVYVLCAVIRLGYFNVMEQKRQQQTDEDKARYHGLPVTTSAWLIPLFYCFRRLIGQGFVPALHVWMLAIAAFFILDFNIRAPSWKNARIAAGVVLVAAAVCIVLFL